MRLHSLDTCARCEAPLTPATTRSRELPAGGGSFVVCPRCNGALDRDRADLVLLEAKLIGARSAEVQA